MYHFNAQKALFKVPKICNINFWIENDPPPPPFGTFTKIHPIWFSHPSLTLFMLFILLYIAVMTTIRAPTVLKMERKNQENIVKIFCLRKRIDKKMK